MCQLLTQQAIYFNAILKPNVIWESCSWANYAQDTVPLDKKFSETWGMFLEKVCCGRLSPQYGVFSGTEARGIAAESVCLDTTGGYATTFHSHLTALSTYSLLTVPSSPPNHCLLNFFWHLIGVGPSLASRYAMKSSHEWIVKKKLEQYCHMPATFWFAYPRLHLPLPWYSPSNL